MWAEVLVAVLTLAWFVFRDRKPAGMPPGPFEIPFFGNIFMTTSADAEFYFKKYGKIFTTRMGTWRMVTVCDLVAAKAAFASPAFSDRPDVFDIFRLNPDVAAGVIFGNGAQWQHDRRLFLRAMRDQGMGKTFMQDEMLLEVEKLIAHFKSITGKPVKLPEAVKIATMNITWQMVASRRYEYDSSDILEFQEAFEKSSSEGTQVMYPMLFPILNFVPKWLVEAVMGENFFESMRQGVRSKIRAVIEEHEEKLDVNNPMDLIDVCLVECKTQSSPADGDVIMNSKVVEQIVYDTFLAGGDNIGNMILFVVHYMVMFPAETKKCQEEIDRVVLGDRLPSLDDQIRLPYVEAFMAEVHRVGVMLLMGLYRTATQDTSILGYNIPKGTVINTSTLHFCRDSNVWSDPDVFRVERFLRQDGSFDNRVPQAPFLFGSGTRKCPAEQLARQATFLFGSALLKTFDVRLPSGVALSTDFIPGFVKRTPEDQAFIYTVRNK